MPPTSYRFRTTWLLRAPSPAVFAAVVDLATYPEWWPDVRSVRRIDDDTAEVVCRATLPFSLTLRMTRVAEDPDAGRLAIALSGDLEGSLTGLVAANGAATRLYIEQRVVARKRLLRTLSPVARPLFRANHAMMMRRGYHGLSGRLARQGPP